ncbi:hypothetical protein DBV15_07226 [Temnothorax longispinosus]|uniref:Uncharacterized protein n=1 Tax=Temnothorax longispinosus TaxID=300112 RepID=A0A4S2JD89_9HYME|nr:hypothetical protein DBV15_07226 [Temnothorax longispinosus]
MEVVHHHGYPVQTRDRWISSLSCYRRGGRMRKAHEYRDRNLYLPVRISLADTRPIFCGKMHPFGAPLFLFVDKFEVLSETLASSLLAS